MNELQTIGTLEAASFQIKNPDLTISQQTILKLLVKRIEDKQPITTEDIVDAYFSCCAQDGKIRVRWNLNYSSCFRCEFFGKDSPQVIPKAIQWFKNNLGGCIVKGKLLVIPIIEI